MSEQGKQQRPSTEVTSKAEEAAGGSGQEEPNASGAAKQKAQELGVDLSKVEGTGPRDQITVKDVQKAHEQDVARKQAQESETLDPHVLQGMQEENRATIEEVRATLVDPLVEAIADNTAATRTLGDGALDSGQPDPTIPSTGEQNIINQYKVLQAILEKPVPIGGRPYGEAVPDFDPNKPPFIVPLTPPADWKPTIPTSNPRLSALPSVIPTNLDIDVVAQNVGTETIVVIAGSEPMEIIDWDFIGPNFDFFMVQGRGTECPEGQPIQPLETCTLTVQCDRTGSELPPPKLYAQLRIFVTTSSVPLTVGLIGRTSTTDSD